MLAFYFRYKTIKIKLINKLPIMISFSLRMKFIAATVRTSAMIEPGANPQVEVRKIFLNRAFD